MITAKEKLASLRKNSFIVIEGVNGAGKTSVKKHILSLLSEKKINFVDTFEPGDTNLGKSLRELLLGEKRDIKSNLAELFLFAADRAEHIENVIKPAIREKKVVICDRYYYSTTAFQGYGRKNDLELVNSINNIAVGSVFPDLVILLDIDAERGLKRNRKSQVSGDTFSVDALEKETLEFHNLIRNGFLQIAKDSKEPFIIIDASKDLNAVLAEAGQIVSAYLGVN
jgi:dTMP kinase